MVKATWAKGGQVAAAVEKPASAAMAELEQLFLAHHVRALKAAYRVTGSMADAEDIAQAVFLRIAQQGQGRAAIENPDSYVYRAAINGALDLLRRRCRDTELDDALPAGADAARGVETRELRAGLRRALATLGPKAAEMFVLRYVEDYDNAAIARLLRTSRAVVAVVLHRARTRLRRELRSHTAPHDAKSGRHGDPEKRGKP
jgi:RNA polymerase sigma factor (sigma-70 family)